MDNQSGAPRAVVGPQALEPGGQGGNVVGPQAGRDCLAKPDEGVAAGVALPVEGPPPADRDLHLDHRLKPVDVGPLEQPDLDQSHSAGESNNAGRLREWTPCTRPARRSARTSSRSSKRSSRTSCRLTSKTCPPWSTWTAGATPRPVSIRSAHG